MMKTFLDPEGRMGPDAFLKAALILVGIGAVFGLLPLLTGSLYLSFVSIVFLYPWVVIWLKRLHDAGKSGWMFLAVLVPYLIVLFTASHFVNAEFAPAPGVPPKDFASAMALGTAQMQAVAIPNAIVSTIISLVFVLLGNALLKSDPGPNAYDSPA